MPFVAVQQETPRLFPLNDHLRPRAGEHWAVDGWTWLENDFDYGNPAQKMISTIRTQQVQPEQLDPKLENA